MLEAIDLSFGYRTTGAVLDGVHLRLAPTEVVGLSGRSGIGKSTLGRILSGHLVPNTGAILMDGNPLKPGWSPVQYVHQSAVMAVNPRWRIGQIIEEGWAPDEATRAALGVRRAWYDRFPHEVSGGELQRIALLRAMSPQTRFLIADELTTMLDPITQMDIWRFLLDRCRAGLGILAITHDEMLLNRIASRRLSLVAGTLRTRTARPPEHRDLEPLKEPA